MNRKHLIITLTLLFAFISVGFFATSVVAKKEPARTVRPLSDEDALLGLTHENFIKREQEMVSTPVQESYSYEPAEVGDGFVFTVSDDGLGVDYDEDFVVVLEGANSLILITLDAYISFDGEFYHFANPIGDDSEPWLRSEDLLSHADLEYMLDQFDNNIYPTDTSIFGFPLPRGEEGHKVWTLIFNIRDDAYYNPDAESYIAGYFSSSESTENNKNIMHIDTYDWENRVGPDAARPYLYEGTFAHEFQHMIHNDQDSDEPSWVDEACAEMAMYMCGYGHPSGHIAYYFVYHETTPLTFWGGGLWDYGISYLWALYMFEHYGGAEFFTALVAEQANGIEGVENTLALFGYKDSFDEIFDALTIAMYLDDTKKAGGKYGFDLIDIGSEDTWGYTIPWALNTFFGAPYDDSFLGIPYIYSDWWYLNPQPYTAHYYPFTNENEVEVMIDGDDWAGNLAYSGDYQWYSDALVWAHRSFYQTFTIPATGATLNFRTYFEIEEDWDYGYVEVYDQDTGEWYTLDAPGTVNYVAHPQDNPNCPAGREPSDYETAGRWHAFTGYSAGYMPVSMDLTPFAGHVIDLYFTTWQDGAFTLQMMYVDDISIPEIGFSDDVEAGEDGWAATDGWHISTGQFDNSWGVTIIDTKWVSWDRYFEGYGNNAQRLHNIKTINVDPITEFGTLCIGETPAASRRVRVAIVTNHADHSHD